MPIIRSNNREYIEVVVPGQIACHGVVIDTGAPINEEWLGLFYRRLARTGCLTATMDEAMQEARLCSGILDISLADIKSNEGLIVGILKDGGQLPTGSFGYGYVDPSTGALDLPRQVITTELSPLVQSQVDQIVTGVNSKLLDRLRQFGDTRPGQEQVDESTKSAVNDLVARLCKQSDTVSATVSNDGMLSIAAVFRNEVRLYVEIERDGSVGAAVTRERRYARDILVNTVADLGPEVLLAAVESI